MYVSIANGFYNRNSCEFSKYLVVRHEGSINFFSIFFTAFHHPFMSTSLGLPSIVHIRSINVPVRSDEPALRTWQPELGPVHSLSKIEVIDLVGLTST